MLAALLRNGCMIRFRSVPFLSVQIAEVKVNKQGAKEKRNQEHHIGDVATVEENFVLHSGLNYRVNSSGSGSGNQFIGQAVNLFTKGKDHSALISKRIVERGIVEMLVPINLTLWKKRSSISY
jgi:hypothetical protein